MADKNERKENCYGIKKPKKVIHLLSSNKYSGAENVACQIISLFEDDKDIEIAYASPDGEIRDALSERNIKFLPMQKMSKSEIKKVIKMFQPDIIHAHDPKAICLSAMASEKIKIIAHLHSNRPDFRKRTILSTIFSHYVKLSKIKKIFWVSNSCFNSFFNKNNKKIKEKSSVLNNIINCEKLAEKADLAEIKDGADIVYLGRLTYPKNPERLIEIIKIVKQKLPKIKLAVIGSGDLKEKVEQLVKENNLEENIIFYGFMNNGYGILKNSKVFLLTSRFEGNPMCVLEAQSFGLPIVSTEIDELKTLIKHGETGYLYNTNEEAAAFILELLKNKELYEREKLNITNFSKKYNDMLVYRKELLKEYAR